MHLNLAIDRFICASACVRWLWLPHEVNCVTFCFWRCLWLLLVVYEISWEPLNGFAPNSQGRRAWSLAPSLKVKVKGQSHKVNFGGLRVVCLEKHICSSLYFTRAVQPVATCRQSPYLHKPAIVIVTSLSLWRLAPMALAVLAAPVLIMMSFSLWRHSLLSWPRPPLRTYERTYRHLTAFNI